MSSRKSAASTGSRPGLAYALISIILMLPTWVEASTLSISGSPSTSIVAANYYSFQPSTYNTAGRTLVFAVSGKPSWAYFNSTSGRIYGTPLTANVGTTFGIVVSVSNGLQRAALPGFAVKVLPLPKIPPTLSGTPAATVVVPLAYSFQPTAKDPNGLRLAFGISNKPSWLNFDSSTGRLYGTSSTAAIGTYSNIGIVVYDGYEKAVLPVFAITVKPTAGVPTSPTGSVTLSWTPPTDNTDGSALTNLAGYNIYYGTTATNLTSKDQIGNPGLANYVIEGLVPGRWYFEMTAYGATGVESSRTQIVSILQ
jgi:putative Ig domain-containing protein